jgi:phage tail tape-measure protein
VLSVATVGAYQGLNAYQQLKDINGNTDMSASEKGRAKGGVVGTAIGTTLGTAGGAVAGAILAGKVGAMIGTAIAPGVGTAIGGAIGLAGGALVGWIGGKLGNKVGEEIGYALADDKQTPRTIPASRLPPELLRENNITAQTVSLDGQAEMKVDINLSGQMPSATVAFVNNSTPFRFPPGAVRVARNLP